MYIHIITWAFPQIFAWLVKRESAELNQLLVFLNLAHWDAAFWIGVRLK